MEKFKIGDKVVFKKEVLDAISKTNYVKSHRGVFLSKEYYDYLIKETDFKKLGYFEVGEVDAENLFIGLYIGKDLFEHYQEKSPQEECPYKIGDELTIGDYKGSIDIDKDSMGYYFLNLGSQTLTHFSTCDKLKELFGWKVFKDTAYNCSACHCDGAFPEFNSIEDLVTFVNELNKLLDSKKESTLTITKNYQNNEIKFQRAKASSKRGTVPAGSTISGRKDKIAISIGHLSYQVCNC